MNSSIKKRSIVINGHKTSVTLEEPFWIGLVEFADGSNATISSVVPAINPVVRRATFPRLSGCLFSNAPVLTHCGRRMKTLANRPLFPLPLSRTRRAIYGETFRENGTPLNIPCETGSWVVASVFSSLLVSIFSLGLLLINVVARCRRDCVVDSGWLLRGPA